MGISKSILLLFILICSSISVGHSQGGDSLKCVQKLLPCQAYLKGSSAPPALCCVPLKEIVAGDGQCLCEVFNDPTLLKSLNVTQDDALNLAKSCGANADTSICNKAASPSTPTAPSTNGTTMIPPPHEKNSATSIAAAAAAWATIMIFIGLGF